VAILSNDPMAAETELSHITITASGDDAHFINNAISDRGLARLVFAQVPLHSLILMLIGT
jgi:hypothetical protein